MKLVEFALIGAIVWIICTAHAFFLIQWFKKNMPDLIKKNTSSTPQTLERGLLTRLAEATDGTRFYNRKY